MPLTEAEIEKFEEERVRAEVKLKYKKEEETKKSSLVNMAIYLLAGVSVVFSVLSHSLIPLVLVIGLLIYLLPSIVGYKKKNANAIMVLNIFLGWTLVGWVVALVWANTKD